MRRDSCTNAVKRLSGHPAAELGGDDSITDLQKSQQTSETYDAECFHHTTSFEQLRTLDVSIPNDTRSG